VGLSDEVRKTAAGAYDRKHVRELLPDNGLIDEALAKRFALVRPLEALRGDEALLARCVGT
jgi:hypothetical protein